MQDIGMIVRPFAVEDPELSRRVGLTVLDIKTLCGFHGAFFLRPDLASSFTLREIGFVWVCFFSAVGAAKSAYILVIKELT